MKTELLDFFKYPFLNEIIQPHSPLRNDYIEIYGETCSIRIF